ncbi:MAG: gamma-glutamyl-gamma-aminobutyrate hydrolase family protein [Bacillota bacterium]
MSPIIGLSTAQDFDLVTRNVLSTEYTRGVEKGGGVPVIVPLLDSLDVARSLVEALDGLLVTGGPDLDPVTFGEDPHFKLGKISPERDFVELAMTKLALERGLPVLGICRGIQVLNVAAGGTLIQDIPSHTKSPIKHYQEAPRWYPTHGIKLGDGRFAGFMGTKELRVNSFHHQAVRDLAPGFVVTAEAPDGIIEAIESKEHPFAVGLQFHPECMWSRDPVFERPFRALVEAAETWRSQAAKRR